MNPEPPQPWRRKPPSWVRNWSHRRLKRLLHPHEHPENPKPTEPIEQFDALGTPAPSSMTSVTHGDPSQETMSSWQRTEPQSPLTPYPSRTSTWIWAYIKKMRRYQIGGENSVSSATQVPRSSVNGRCRSWWESKLWPSGYLRPNKKRAACGMLHPAWPGWN